MISDENFRLSRSTSANHVIRPNGPRVECRYDLWMDQGLVFILLRAEVIQPFGGTPSSDIQKLLKDMNSSIWSNSVIKILQNGEARMPEINHGQPFRFSTL